MLYFRLLLVTVLLFICKQDSSAQVINLGKDNTLQAPLPLYLNNGSFYIDSTNNQNITAVYERPFYPFPHYFKTAPKHLNTGVSVWVKVQIQSFFQNDTSVVFYPGFQNYVEVFHAVGGRFTRTGICGNLFPASLLTIENTRQAVYLPLAAGQLNTFFIRIRNITTYHVDAFRPYLMSKASLDALQVYAIAHNQRSGYLFFIGIGTFVIMFFYIIITWVYMRDVAYLYYAMTIGCSGIFFLLNFLQDHNNQLFLEENPLLIYLLPDAFALLSLYAYWQFIRKFLYLQTRTPALDRFMFYTSNGILALFVFNVWYAFQYRNLMGLVAMDTTAGIALIIIGSYTLTRVSKVNAPLRKFIYGGIFSMLFFYALGSVYELIRDTSWNIFPDMGGGTPLVMMGNISEMLFFTLGLAYRTKLEAAGKADAEIKALRAQMNPHFIFNCMHTIDAYIFREQPEKASRFLNTFSKLMRLVLENSQHALVPVSTELAGLQLFTQLEQERYDNSFDVHYHISPKLANCHYKIPPLLVQPYVENAILHGLRHKKTGRGTLHISFEVIENKLLISVKDNGIGRQAAQRIQTANGRTHEPLALSLTKQRLELMPQKGTVEIIDITGNENTGTEVRLLLPVII
jgi:hypothetical protein